MKITYLLRVMSGARFSKMKKVIDDVSHKTNKNKFIIFVDMINCSIRYGAGYYDYNIFDFYNLSHKQRKTYVTRFKNKKIISLCNDPKESYIFQRKNAFYKRFKNYLKREFLDLSEINFNDFKNFIENKNTIIAKPNCGTSGKGIEKLEKNDFDNIEAMYSYITDPKNNFGVIEELVIQHDDISKLYPHSVNTLRVVSIVDDNKVPHIVYAVCKTGNNGKFVDNLENGGVFFPIDIETGKVDGRARNSKLIYFDKHPYSDIELIGYQIPFVKEAMELVKQAALEVKEVRFVGWDVAITKDGPLIIEGNDYPGYDFWQITEYSKDKIGLYPYYKKILPRLR